MTTLVLGSSGQLASHLKQLLPEATCWGHAQCDLNDLVFAREAVERFRPDCIVNAAAYTAVDRAEDEPARAWQLNAEAVAAMSEVASARGIPFVHISTDYVFDGTCSREYEVGDPQNPINVYGRTKLAGELAATTLCKDHFVFRVSWLFSEFGHNFVRTMLRLGAERESLSIVDDQRGIPTYAGDLARAVAASVNAGTSGGLEPGVYHVTGGRPVSWYQFAERIFATARQLGILQRTPELRPIPTQEYPTPAKRPLNSVLKPSAEIDSRLGVSLDWESHVADVLRRLAA